MLYHVLYSFHTQLSVLNVTRYITFRTAAASVTALAISLALGPWMIRRLRAAQVGQIIRTEGPVGHQPKAGTPTMGGLLILTAALTPTLLWADLTNTYVWIAMLSTLAFGAIGFADDYLKLTRQSHHGLRPRYKLVAQVGVATGVGIVLLVLAGENLYNTRLIFPFFKNAIPDLGWLYVPFAVLVLVGASNAVNLTDGLDGLAIGTFTVAAAAFTCLAYVTGHRVLAEYLLLVRFSPAAELTIFCGSLVGASLGFLWYNSYPGRSVHGRRRVAGAGWGARYRRRADQAGAVAAARRRRVRARGALRDHPGRFLQADRAPRVQDGAAPPPLRAHRVERAKDHQPLSDRLGRVRAVQFDDAETAVETQGD